MPSDNDERKETKIHNTRSTSKRDRDEEEEGADDEEEQVEGEFAVPAKKRGKKARVHPNFTFPNGRSVEYLYDHALPAQRKNYDGFVQLSVGVTSAFKNVCMNNTLRNFSLEYRRFREEYRNWVQYMKVVNTIVRADGEFMRCRGNLNAAIGLINKDLSYMEHCISFGVRNMEQTQKAVEDHVIPYIRSIVGAGTFLNGYEDEEATSTPQTACSQTEECPSHSDNSLRPSDPCSEDLAR